MEIREDLKKSVLKDISRYKVPVLVQISSSFLLIPPHSSSPPAHLLLTTTTPPSHPHHTPPHSLKVLEGSRRLVEVV